MRRSFIEFITGGSWSGNALMLLLFMLSIVAVYIFVERYLVLLRTKKEIKLFVKQMHGFIASRNYKDALRLLRSHNSIAASVLNKSLQAMGRKNIGINDANLVIDAIASSETARLERGFSNLASISGGAPMIGFLGTVIGMVQAFYEMSVTQGSFDVGSLSQGIYTAMFTTVGGLTVGIIAYFAYNTLVSKLQSVTTDLESVKIDYIELLNHQ